ncbi:MAG TPA: hypothetical protein VKB52_11535 [Rhodanobacteraceae bacterium]|nr:hypothetical protein [Rhodanobacteraceae bacterium]
MFQVTTFNGVEAAHATPHRAMTDIATSPTTKKRSAGRLPRQVEEPAGSGRDAISPQTLRCAGVPALAASWIDGSPRIPACLQKTDARFGMAGGNVHANAGSVGRSPGAFNAQQCGQLSNFLAVARKVKHPAEISFTDRRSDSDVTARGR